MFFRTPYQSRFVLATSCAVLFFQWIVPSHSLLLHFFIEYIFTPVQKAKTAVFNYWNAPLGEWIYGMIIVWLLYVFIRWLYALVKRRKSDYQRDSNFLLTISMLGVWLLFAFNWNVVYQRPRLLSIQENTKYGFNEELQLSYWINEQLKSYTDSVDRIDADITTEIINIYQKRFNHLPRLKYKHTLIAPLLRAMVVQGYYNPITSEAYIDPDLPNALQPFVVAHELAHLLGVASEGDANLLAFDICYSSELPNIRYSALLNLFLYNIRTIRYHDSTLANEIRTTLPRYVLEDLEEIKRYQEDKPWHIYQWTLPIYNWFLRMNGDKSGIQSYSNLTKYVYFQELSKQKKVDLIVHPYSLKLD